MASLDHLVGRTLGAYEIQGVIGKGGMATIYRAWHPALERHAAIKVLSPHLLSDTEFVQRFQQEARTAAKLKHPNIVTIYDVTHQDHYYYIVMEYVEGRPLDEIIVQSGPLPWERVLQIVEQIGSALDYIHQNGLIHRDIKPANIIIKPDGNVVLSDFGIAKTASSSGRSQQLTQIGVVMGTPAYMSPEQIEGQDIDFRTDLYALGVVCYEMLTGQVPFAGTTTAALLSAQLTKLPPSIRQLDQDLPPHIEQSVHRMLSKNPDNRFQSASEFVACLSGNQELPPQVAEEPILEETWAVNGPRVDTSAPTRIYRPSESRLEPTLEILAEPSGQDSPAPAKPRQSRWIMGIAAVVVILIIGIILGTTFVIPQVVRAFARTTPTLTLDVETPEVAATPSVTPLPAFPTAKPTSTPTPLPATTSTPLASPTPRQLRSPHLQFPVDGAFFKGQSISLTWQQTETLQENEFYVVSIRAVDQTPVAEFWRQETRLDIPVSFFEQVASSGQYDWSVQVVLCTQGCDRALTDSTSKQGVVISDPSDEWTFYWFPVRLPKGISEG